TAQEYGRPSGIDFEVKDWGFAVRSITKQMALDQRLERMDGVVVGGVRAGGPAEEAGLPPRDGGFSVDGTPRAGLGSFRAAYKARVDAGKTRIMLHVRRRDSGRYVLLKLSSSKDEGS